MARVRRCCNQNFDNHKFNVFTIKFTKLTMKTFEGVIALIVFDLQINDVIKETQYPVSEKSADLYQEHFLREQ